MTLNELFTEEKVRLDPKCWTGKKIGDPKTKVKGGVRVNNCVPAESIAEGSEESYMIIRTDAEGKQDVFAKFDTYEKAQKELDACLAHPLHTKYKQKFELKRKGQQGQQGVAEDSTAHDCKHCNGKGYHTVTKKDGTKVATNCPQCKGKGYIVTKGVAEGSEDPFGPQGRFVGDTGPAQITTTVARVQLKPGDKVLYKPTEQRARIEAMSRDGTQARIHIPSPMGGKTFNCKTSDLKALGALKEKSTSQAQFRTMAAAAHDPKFARKVGIKQSVAREFNRADKGQSYKSLPKRAD